MSRELNERDAYEKLVDNLKMAADAAHQLGTGKHKDSEAKLHATFSAGLREAEMACRKIARDRGVNGFGWVSVARTLGKMIETSNRAAQNSIIHTLAGVKNAPRGPLWVKLGEGLAVIAYDCKKAIGQKTDKTLTLGGMEYIN